MDKPVRFSLFIKHPSPDLQDNEEYMNGRQVINITAALKDLPADLKAMEDRVSVGIPSYVANLMIKAVEAGHHRIELLMGDTEYKLYVKPEEKDYSNAALARANDHRYDDLIEVEKILKPTIFFIGSNDNLKRLPNDLRVNGVASIIISRVWGCYQIFDSIYSGKPTTNYGPGSAFYNDAVNVLKACGYQVADTKIQIPNE